MKRLFSQLFGPSVATSTPATRHGVSLGLQKLKKTALLILAGIALTFATGSRVFAQDQTLEEAVDTAVNLATSKKFRVSGHQYRLDPAKITRTGDVVRSEARLKHYIDGTNDFVHYVIEAKKGQAPKVTLDRIEYGGLFGPSSRVKLAVTWVGQRAGGVPRVDNAIKALNIALKGLNAIQRRLI